jgi:hypothetical protein
MGIRTISVLPSSLLSALCVMPLSFRPAAARRLGWRQHVDIWFQNLESGALFDPGELAVASLDYSRPAKAAPLRQ